MQWLFELDKINNKPYKAILPVEWHFNEANPLEPKRTNYIRASKNYPDHLFSLVDFLFVLHVPGFQDQQYISHISSNFQATLATCNIHFAYLLFQTPKE